MFIMHRVQPRPEDGKTDKVPTCPYTHTNINSQDPAQWLLPYEAKVWADQWNLNKQPGVIEYGVGLVITEGCGIAFIDLDACRSDNGGWLPHVRAFEDRFPGAAVETSVSGTGRHLFVGYAGTPPDHRTRNKDYKAEAYTRLRFAAITGTDAAGSVLTDNTEALRLFLTEFFPPREEVEHGVEWTSTACPEWSGPADDDELIARARRSHNLRGVFGGGARFEDLWTGDVEILSRAFPATTHDAYDRSRADQALSNHLAFWTGNNCDRMWRLMQRSALVRPKWGRFDTYIRPTILDSCATQRQWYSDRAQSLPDMSSPAMLAQQSGMPDAVTGRDVPPPPTVTVEFVVPPPPNVPPPPETEAPIPPGELPAPSAYVTIQMQRAIFTGFCYVEDIHRIQRADGTTITKDRFDVMFGGRKWAMTADGQHPSKSAWDAYVGNEIWDHPRVRTQYFAPNEPTGTVRWREGHREINCYKPAEIRRVSGDPTPLVTHLQRLLPNDWELMLYTMAGRVQFLGEKFMWAPFLQGCKGNGKTMLGRILEYAIGPRYVHWPKSDQVDEKFNASFTDKLLLIVDELPKNGYDIEPVLNTLVTATRLETRPMYAEKIMKDVCFNLWFISNYTGSLQCDPDQRRYAPFFCAQQRKKDLVRDGLTPDYFIRLRTWLEHEDGYAICAEYLSTLQIPETLRPSTCVRAPDTSNTHTANVASRAPAEQEVHHAIEQGLDGFRGGWISSIAVDHLLARVGKEKAIPRNHREALIESCGYVAHPSLTDGLCTSPMPDGTQPRLYVREGHPWAVDYLNAEQVRAGYLEAQKR